MSFDNIAGINVKLPGVVGAVMPADCIVFFDDFEKITYHATLDTLGADWVETFVGTATGLSILDGTDTVDDTGAGILSIVTEASVADGEQLQGNCECFHIAPEAPLYFEARLAVGDVSNTDLFIGLCVTDTTINAGVNDCIGFRLVETVHSFITEQATVEELTTIAVPTDKVLATLGDWYRVAFYYDGLDTIKAYLDLNDNGVFTQVATRTVSVSTDDVPDDVYMTPSISAIVGDTATVESVWVDYVLCMQGRYRNPAL